MATAVQPHSSSNAPRRAYVVPQQSAPPTSSKGDPYHGQEVLAKLAAKFITHLFACPDYPPNPGHTHAKLPFFIAYALHRTKLNVAVTFAALVLLQRLKARFPSARGSSGHRLFISAYMISSKVMCDDTYSNKSWCIVAQGMFTLREINQMEREMCNYLDWELTVDDPILSTFEEAVKKDFGSGSKQPYPSYPNLFVSKRALRASMQQQLPEELGKSSSPVPGFGGSKPATPIKTSSPGTPTKVWDATTPDTPSPSFSTATSPTSSASPATPIGDHNPHAKIRGVDHTSPIFGCTDSGFPLHPLKSDMYAYAAPSGW